MNKCVSISCTFAVLLIAVGLVVLARTQAPVAHFQGGLRKMLPTSVAEWHAEEKPIAETEEMQKAVGRILNYDEGVFITYTWGTRQVSVYLAYWSPGKMNYREVASHTPDVCWVGAGWNRKNMSIVPRLPIGETLAPPGEARVFEMQGKEQYVWFWHVIGSSVQSYRTGSKPAWYATVTDVFTRGLKQREEQFFIRISANEPLDNLLADPLLPAILEGLPLPRTPKQNGS
jgi:hypothetical protein